MIKIANNEKAFTIIELLVTTAILAILSSLGIAQFAGYQDVAYHVNAKQQLVDARTALEARYADNAEFNYVEVMIENDSSVSSLTAGESVYTIVPGFNHLPGVTLFVSAFGNLSGSGERTVYAQHCNGPDNGAGFNTIWHWVSLDIGVNALTERNDINHPCI